MTFMAFSQLAGDMSSASKNLELARRLYEAEGASRVAGSISLTGQNVGSFTLSTMWDSSDACFAARAKVLGMEEMQAAMAAAGLSVTARDEKRPRSSTRSSSESKDESFSSLAAAVVAGASSR